MLRKLIGLYSEAEFVCHVREDLDEETRRAYRAACSRLSFYAKHEGNSYCVLHYPSEGKENDFEKVRESKLAEKDYDFSGTVFPEGCSRFGRVNGAYLAFENKIRFEGARSLHVS
jgi:hypothetical protein